MQDATEHLGPGHGEYQGERQRRRRSLTQRHPQLRLVIGKPDNFAGSQLAIRAADGHGVASNHFDHGLQVRQASTAQNGTVSCHEILVKQ